VVQHAEHHDQVEARCRVPRFIENVGLDEDPRFASRIVPCTLVPSEDLEPGDTFLRWGAADAPPRYCHFADAAEVLALCDTTGLSRVAHFRSDGRGDALNEYVVLRSNA
jgi:hypothetical protein